MYQMIVFFNRVFHMISIMFVSGMCTLSYLSSNNLFASSNLASWSYFFGAVVLFTGLFNVYHLHRWFKYFRSDRKARSFVIMITFKLLIVLTLTEYFDLILAKANVSYSTAALNTFRFYAIVVLFLLSTHMKFYKEKYITKNGSEMDHLV